ncbi:Major facilitator superfamily domain general substrate transporter [Penicillium sp. DV-2018c]|nr:Major facilitator superfamily domain general substrate transporter [Penicillium sp. DV-2018c]
MKHCRRDDERNEGCKSIARLRAHPIVAARYFYYSVIIYEEELKEARSAPTHSRHRRSYLERSGARNKQGIRVGTWDS